MHFVRLALRYCVDLSPFYHVSLYTNDSFLTPLRVPFLILRKLLKKEARDQKGLTSGASVVQLNDERSAILLLVGERSVHQSGDFGIDDRRLAAPHLGVYQNGGVGSVDRPASDARPGAHRDHAVRGVARRLNRRLGRHFDGGRHLVVPLDVAEGSARRPGAVHRLSESQTIAPLAELDGKETNL